MYVFTIDDATSTAGDSVSVKYGKEYIAATLIGKGDIKSLKILESRLLNHDDPVEGKKLKRQKCKQGKENKFKNIESKKVKSKKSGKGKKSKEDFIICSLGISPYTDLLVTNVTDATHTCTSNDMDDMDDIQCSECTSNDINLDTSLNLSFGSYFNDDDVPSLPEPVIQLHFTEQIQYLKSCHR